MAFRIKLVFASVAATRNQAEAFLRPSEEEEFVDIEQRGRGGGCFGPGRESVVDVDVDDVTGRRELLNASIRFRRR